MAGFAFTDFEEFVSALRGVQGRYVPTMRSTRQWQLRVLELGDATVMTGQGGASNIYHGVCLPDFFTVIVPLSKPQAIAIDGNLMTREFVAWLPANREFQFRAYIPTRWLGINLRRAMVQSRLEQSGQAVPALLARNQIFQADMRAIFELVVLSRRALRVQAHDPQTFTHDTVCNNLCHQLLEAVLRCAASVEIDDSRGPGRPKVDRRKVLDHALSIIDASMHKTLYVDDLCRGARVTPRTLQAIFIEHFGMTPHRYLALRRLCAIHAAIRSAAPGQTVSSICERFGVWDFGRFSSQYRRHFGALPSQDLGRGRLRLPH
ncbi:AraC family ethanolamine operon transcriptional activator [Lysobacter niastensis]|uniref:AraC family ethanolamine operon transcriptional activator n=1 Tax=Lysobacter niastensis TaxID=380629 RepID=A0ABU1WAF6_9GAMM|nr:helix-turn-helix domain-containing protein [Lysobacter niastensis]MDR7134553.1 AraC family ethanolamine operon transcriptional activator [Lysobacter niastensis]